jgi:hypothetical protein
VSFMAYAGKMGKNSTLGSALLLLLLAVVAIIIAVFLILNIDTLENLAVIFIIVVIVIVIAVIMIYIIMAILALPYYAAKGETYQTDRSYNLDDVRPVKEKDSEKDDGDRT